MIKRFGVRLDGWMTSQRCVEVARAADAAGFDALWFAENPYGRGVIPSVAACMIATQRIEVGIGVFNPFNRHPSLIAMEMGALDELSGGRSNLGVGTGVARILKKASLGSDKPIAAMRDTINIVRALMTGEAATYQGKVFSVEDLQLEFKPVRTDYPITMAAMGDQSLRLAGELADGVMISNLCTPGFTRRALEVMQPAFEKRTRPHPPKIVQYAPCVVGPDRKAARDFAKNIVGGMILRSFGEEGTKTTHEWHMMGSNLPPEFYYEMFDRLKAGERGAAVVTDEVLDLYAVAGDRDDCLAAYRRYAEAGVTEMVITFRGEEPLKDMAYLAKTVEELRA